MNARITHLFVLSLVTLGLASPAYADTATISIYVDTTLATSSTVSIPTPGSPDVSITPTAGGAQTAPADSAIALLSDVDAHSADFDITQLDYYPGLGFQVSCISIPSASSSPLCTLFPPSWLFAINGVAPTVGMSAVNLHDGDIMQIYYSSASSRRVVVNTSPVTVDTPFTVEAQEIDPATGMYHPATGFTIDLGTVSGYSFNTIESTSTDAGGHAVFTLSATGTYAVALQQDYDFPSTSFTVEAAPAPSAAASGGGGGIAHYQLNVATALSFLSGKQKQDGSFGAPLYSDWVAIALGSQSDSLMKSRLREYERTSPLEMATLTDHERRAMALMALGIDPYSGALENHIRAITNEFDGAQLGDSSLVNDDIFALVPLLRAGYNASDDIISKVTAFILSRQEQSGAWNGSIDMTAAAVQSLSPLQTLPGVSDALQKARSYLRAQQQPNGGWGNSFATSWVLQAIHALGESPLSWAPASDNGYDYLARLQQQDGGVESTASNADSRVWATAYALPASLDKEWGDLLQAFTKPSDIGISGGSTVITSSSTSIVLPTASSTIATSTPDLSDATSTPTFSTSTPPLVTQSTSSTSPNTIAVRPKAHKQSSLTIRHTPRPQLTTEITPIRAISQTASPAPSGMIGAWMHALASLFRALF